MGDYTTVEELLDDPLEAPMQPVMRAEHADCVVHPHTASYNCPFVT